MASAPVGRDVVEKTAAPLLCNAAEPMTTPSSRKLTVPVGVAAPVVAGVTVAVRVTSPPALTGCADAARLVTSDRGVIGSEAAPRTLATPPESVETAVPAP